MAVEVSVTSAIQLSVHDAIPVAVIRRVVSRADLPRVVPDGCGLVWAALRAQGLKGGRHVAIYWNGDIRLEVGAEISAPFEQRDGLVRSATPSGRVAAATHFGPYQHLGQAHQAVVDWCRAQGHQLAGPNWEIYGHWESAWDANPSLIRTDVCYLVAAQ